MSCSSLPLLFFGRTCCLHWLQGTVEQIIDIPVPGRGGGGGRGGLQGFSSGQNSTARLVEQNVDIPVPAAHPQFRVMSVKMFFSHFSPGLKKVRSPPRVRVRGCPPGRAHELLAAYTGGAGRGRVLRVQRRLVEAGLEPGAPVDPDDGFCFLPVWSLGVYPEGTVTWSRPGTWSWPCDSFCTWGRPGESSWPLDRVRDGVLLVVLRRLRPCEHAAQVPAVRSDDSGLPRL